MFRGKVPKGGAPNHASPRRHLGKNGPILDAAQAIRDRITAGTLPGRKIGRNWLVPTAALAS